MEKEKTAVFDAENAAALVANLRHTYETGKTRSYKWRSEQIRMIVRLIEEKERDIVDVLHDDLRKPHPDAIIQEVLPAKKSCDIALKNLKSWMKHEKVPSNMIFFPSSAEIVSEPLGVVLIITPWNYPFLLSVEPIVGAIAAGNCVVLKSSEISSAASAFLARVLPEYLDNSAVRVVEGAVAEATALLEQRWDKIMYTGNGRVGRIVSAAAAKHLTPLILELGGKSPVVVDSNVDLKVATKRIAAGKWGFNNGQACIAPDYIITTRSFAPKLVEELKNTLLDFYGEEASNSKDLSRVVNSNHFRRLLKLLEDDKISGKIVHGGQRDEKQLYIAPTIILDVPGDALIMNEEIFGPLLPIVLVDKVEECFGLINSGDKPLAAYLFTKDKKFEEEYIKRISSGGMCINDTCVHLGVSSLPFGGVGESGSGSYHGKHSFDAFSHRKGVLRRSFAGEAPVRYPPYTTKKEKILRALLSGNILGLILAILGWS